MSSFLWLPGRRPSILSQSSRRLGRAPQGSRKDGRDLIAQLRQHEEITSAALLIGGTAPRFYCNVVPGEPGTHAAQVLVNTRRDTDVPPLPMKLRETLDRHLAGALCRETTRTGPALQGLALPPGCRLTFASEDQELRKSRVEMGQVIAVSLGLIALAMVIQFNSVAKSFVVMLTVPLGLIGAFLGLASLRLLEVLRTASQARAGCTGSLGRKTSAMMACSAEVAASPANNQK